MAIKKLLEDGATSPAGSRRGSRRPSLLVSSPAPGSRRDSIIMDLAVSHESPFVVKRKPLDGSANEQGRALRGVPTC